MAIQIAVFLTLSISIRKFHLSHPLMRTASSDPAFQFTLPRLCSSMSQYGHTNSALLGSQSPSPPPARSTNAPAIAGVNASPKPENTSNMVAVTIQYRRLYFELDESEMAPMRGWATSPDMGPASQTSEVSWRERPRERR